MTKEQENRRDELAEFHYQNDGCLEVHELAGFKTGYNAGFTDGERSGISEVIEYLIEGTKKWNDTSAYGAVDILERLEEHFSDVLKGEK